jgi:general secretion pathway protein C
MSSLVQPALSGRLAIASSGVLVVIGLWLLLRVVWLVLGGPTVPVAPVPPVPTMTQATQIEGDFRWQLFGESRSSATPVTQVTAISRTPLKLVGVVSGEDGYAMISDNQNGERVYRVDDELPDGSRLVAIEPSQVILSSNGQNEILALDPSQARSTTLPRAPAGQTRTTTQNPIVRAPITGIRGFQAPAGISIASMPELARSSGFDLSTMATSISAMPVSSGGFRVRPGSNAQLFTQLGLQVNDVVTAINGQPLTSESQLQSAFNNVLSSGQVAITVNRQGREMVLQPEIDQILRSLQNQ